MEKNENKEKKQDKLKWLILLLLLISGDCQEDQNTALLTLALYLFL